MKPKTAEIAEPAIQVIHHIGKALKRDKLKIACITPHIPQKQNTNPIHPW